jgi:hypothetical protein
LITDPKGTGRKFMQAFSLRKNVLTLFSLSRSPDDIESVHGIRAVSALLLLLAHKSMALFFNPYTNRTVMAEVTTLHAELRFHILSDIESVR